MLTKSCIGSGTSQVPLRLSLALRRILGAVPLHWRRRADCAWSATNGRDAPLPRGGHYLVVRRERGGAKHALRAG